MSLSTYIVVIGAAALLSTGAFGRLMTHLAEDPIPTWFALTIIIPVLMVGLLAIAKGDMDAKEEI